jgi:hypothetical protein
MVSEWFCLSIADDPISTVGNDADDDEKKKKGCIIA